jgi:hypothetical protein
MTVPPEPLADDTDARDKLVAEITEAEQTVKETAAEVVRAQAVHQTARQHVSDLQAQMLVLSRDQVVADFDAAVREAAAAQRTVEQFTFTSAPSVDVLELFREALQICKTANDNMMRLQHDVCVANGWSFNDPARRELYERVHTIAGDDRNWRALNYFEAALRTPRLSDTFLKAARTVRTNGYGEGSSYPCLGCGGPQNGYDDQEYTCRACW